MSSQKETQARFKAKQAEQGLAEVRGLYWPKHDHKRLKSMLRELHKAAINMEGLPAPQMYFSYKRKDK